MNYFDSSGVRLAYRIDGPEDAPTLVLINSLGTNLHMWDFQMPFFEHDLRVVRYDSRGHGASDILTGPYTIEDLGLDLLALLDTLDIERAYICGLSLGGMVALWLASSYPERVKRAIFANTAAHIGSREIWNARINAVRMGGMAGIRDAVLARFLSEEFRRKNPEVVRRIAEMVENTNPLGYIEACAALREGDLRDLLGEIHVPSLILGGALDESTPPFQSEELHAAIPGSKLVILPEVAHLSNVEQPQKFSNLVLPFLLNPQSEESAW